jgi:hypothetical protein
MWFTNPILCAYNTEQSNSHRNPHSVKIGCGVHPASYLTSTCSTSRYNYNFLYTPTFRLLDRKEDKHSDLNNINDAWSWNCALRSSTISHFFTVVYKYCTSDTFLTYLYSVILQLCPAFRYDYLGFLSIYSWINLLTNAQQRFLVFMSSPNKTTTMQSKLPPISEILPYKKGCVFTEKEINTDCTVCIFLTSSLPIFLRYSNYEFKNSQANARPHVAFRYNNCL